MAGRFSHGKYWLSRLRGIRKGDTDTRAFLESRTLLVESKDAARQLADSPHLVFAVRGDAVEVWQVVWRRGIP